MQTALEQISNNRPPSNARFFRERKKTKEKHGKKKRREREKEENPDGTSVAQELSLRKSLRNPGGGLQGNHQVETYL